MACKSKSKVFPENALKIWDWKTQDPEYEREQWRRQLWGTGACAAGPPSISNNFIFSSLWI